MLCDLCFRSQIKIAHKRTFEVHIAKEVLNIHSQHGRRHWFKNAHATSKVVCRILQVASGLDVALIYTVLVLVPV